MRMNRLHCFWIWLSRLRHSRGFGIQSPTDYAFVCNVVNEHSPYYAYDGLARQFPTCNPRRLKLLRLYLRLSNFKQSDFFIDCVDGDPVLNSYVSAGCNKTRTVCDDVGLAPDFVRFSLQRSPAPHLSRLLERADEHSMLVVEDIKADAGSRSRWADLLRDDRVRISYDLYDCGILFFDKKRYKKDYIINF